MQLLDSQGNPLDPKKGRAMAMQDTAHRAASRMARELSSWLPGLASADADLLDELPTLVARSRDLTRNHGIAAGAVQTLVDNVVGTGLRLVATPDFRLLGKTKEWADEWSANVEAQWRAWAENTSCDAARSLTFSGMTGQIFRSGIINGEALALPMWLPERGQTFASTVQLVEPDRLSNPNGAPDSQYLRGGIEIDRYVAPVAYWIRKTHPGDSLLGIMSSVDEWQRVPAFTAFGRRQVIHVHDKERTGQNRGKAKAIRSEDGFWLAIPTPNAPKRGVGGGRISPSNFPEHRYGPLRFIYRRNGPSLLVAENLRPSVSRATGEVRGFRKAKTSRGLSSVVMFWLVPQVKMPKLIRFAEESARWHDQLQGLILKNWPD